MKHSNYRLTDRGSDSFPRYQIDAIVTHPDNTDRAAFEFIAFINDNTLAKFIIANLERGFPYGTAAAPAAAEPLTGHKPNCVMGKGTWSGSPNPNDPDNSWICDECEGIIPSAS